MRIDKLEPLRDIDRNREHIARRIDRRERQLPTGTTKNCDKEQKQKNYNN